MSLIKQTNQYRRKFAFRKPGRSKTVPGLSSNKFTSPPEEKQTGVEVSSLNAATNMSEEDPYETLCCLKWGAHYGLITEAAYESGKVDLLARL